MLHLCFYGTKHLPGSPGIRSIHTPFDSAQGPAQGIGRPMDLAFRNPDSREIPGGLIPKLGRYGVAGKND